MYEKINIIILIVALMEAFAIYHMIIDAIELLLNKIEKMWDKVLTKSAENIEYRNNVASVIFFFSDMGPNVSSFSVIALFITSEENGLILTVIFFAGIIMKEMSRRFKNLFYSEIDKRSS